MRSEFEKIELTLSEISGRYQTLLRLQAENARELPALDVKIADAQDSTTPAEMAALLGRRQRTADDRVQIEKDLADLATAKEAAEIRIESLKSELATVGSDLARDESRLRTLDVMISGYEQQIYTCKGEQAELRESFITTRARIEEIGQPRPAQRSATGF